VTVTPTVVQSEAEDVLLTLTVSPLTTVVGVEVNAPPLMLISHPETEIDAVVVTPCTLPVLEVVRVERATPVTGVKSTKS
jgi:hypothetical protein